MRPCSHRRAADDRSTTVSRVSIDPEIVGAAAFIGLIVGFTGLGGGALLTPVLVIVFGIQPLAAVSSDLVASLAMKPVGAAVHVRRGQVRYDIVKWLALGSVPTAFAGVFVLRAIGAEHAQGRIKDGIGIALLLGVAGLLARPLLDRRAARSTGDVVVPPYRTVLVGLLAGLLVGMTSVGAGSIVMVLLLLVHPKLRPIELVGTDLLQAVPLVGAASLGHIVAGNFKLSLTASLILGAVPAVYIGARLSVRFSGPSLRPVLMVVLMLSALSLLGVPNAVLIAIFAAALLVGGTALARFALERRRVGVSFVDLTDPARVGAGVEASGPG